MFEDLISRIDYFAKDNAWVNNKHNIFSWGKCEHAGHAGLNGNVKLNYAHRDHKHENYEGDIWGGGRGKNTRVLNFIKYPERYYLLCNKCHHEYETKLQRTSPAGFPINFDVEKRDHLNQMKVNRDKKELRQKMRKQIGGIN